MPQKKLAHVQKNCKTLILIKIQRNGPLSFAERTVGRYKYIETVDAEILILGIRIMLVLECQGETVIITAEEKFEINSVIREFVNCYMQDAIRKKNHV